MKIKQTMFMVTAVTVLLITLSFAFSAEKKSNIQYDQFGLPHDMSLGISTYKGSLTGTQKTNFTQKDYISDGKSVSIVGSEDELAIYDEHQDLVSQYQSLSDQTYLESLYASIYGPTGTRKVHLPGKATLLFARHADGHIEALATISTSLVKQKNGVNEVKQIGVQLVESNWNEELSPQDILILSKQM